MGKTITVDLTDEQYEKVKFLEENGVDVAQAIDLLFDARDMIHFQNDKYFDHKLSEYKNEKEELEKKLDNVHKNIEFFSKLTDSSVAFEKKRDMLEREYGTIDETYDSRVQDKKRKINWNSKIFKL